MGQNRTLSDIQVCNGEDDVVRDGVHDGMEWSSRLLYMIEERVSSKSGEARSAMEVEVES